MRIVSNGENKKIYFNLSSAEFFTQSAKRYTLWEEIILSFLLKKKSILFPFFRVGPILRKHAYSNMLKILLSKKENLQIKNSDIVNISAQNIDCGTR